MVDTKEIKPRIIDVAQSYFVRKNSFVWGWTMLMMLIEMPSLAFSFIYKYNILGIVLAVILSLIFIVGLIYIFIVNRKKYKKLTDVYTEEEWVDSFIYVKGMYPQNLYLTHLTTEVRGISKHREWKAKALVKILSCEAKKD
ncbi:hypothetical protein [Mycoplasma hafezii]|uniref:hypothetical protein n=1 Tax=Mycoplasma hafezii TaxID=525886 RepID=UPI003CEC8ADC